MSVRENENSVGGSFRDELEWAAFRYVADEMAAAESAAFERQLSEDQQARETLARTVQIAHAVVSTPAVAATDSAAGDTKHRVSRWASRAAILVIMTICAALAIGLRLSNVTDKPSRPDGPLTDALRDRRDQVLDVWLDLKAEEEPNPNPDVEGVQLTITPDENSPEDDGKFDWIVAAVDPETMENGKLENLRKEQQ